MITERTLKKWRREALTSNKGIKDVISNDPLKHQIKVRFQLNERILRMTQILLDQHLLGKEVR